eukprot:scaffold31599_cov101-Isochrysis_galbana.AAC.2
MAVGCTYSISTFTSSSLPPVKSTTTGCTAAATPGPASVWFSTSSGGSCASIAATGGSAPRTPPGSRLRLGSGDEERE